MTTILSFNPIARHTACIALTLIAGAALLYGCAKDDNSGGADNGDRTPVNFSASISMATRTTTDDATAWVKGDKVGIFMLGTGGASNNILADNREHTVTDASAGTLAAMDGQSIYFPRESAVNFVAYYPYGKKGADAGQMDDDHKYHVDLSDQSDPAAIDVLQAKVFDQTAANNPVQFSFDHLLAKITFEITLGDGMDGMTLDDITDVTFRGMPRTAVMKLLEDDWLEAGATGDFAARQVPTTGKAVFTALVIPQKPNQYKDRTVIFTVRGNKLVWEMKDDEKFETGNNNYIYPVTVRREGVTVGPPSIDTWTPKDNGSAATEEFKVIWVPAGTFQMGTSTDDYAKAPANEQPRHWVRLTKGFYMSQYQITNAQYVEFLNATGIGLDTDGKAKGSVTYDLNGQSQTEIQVFTNSSTTGSGITYDNNTGWAALPGYDNYPIGKVTWYGAKAYADWIGASLPTEAQWEYACRAGTTTPFVTETGTESDLGDYAWDTFNDSNGGYPAGTKPVGLKKPNPWELYDMQGNVYEWCLDQWDMSNNYQAAETEEVAITDPLVIKGGLRIIRGGARNSKPNNCRPGARGFANPVSMEPGYGFRMVFNE